MDIADNFSVFATRQQITRFIEIHKYWELIKNIPGNILECGVGGGSFLFSIAHFCSMCGPHFCSMKITQDIRDYARNKGLKDIKVAVDFGLEEKSKEFKELGNEIYIKK